MHEVRSDEPEWLHVLQDAVAVFHGHLDRHCSNTETVRLAVGVVPSLQRLIYGEVNEGGTKIDSHIGSGSDGISGQGLRRDWEWA